jgi:hypothetical protein
VETKENRKEYILGNKRNPKVLCYGKKGVSLEKTYNTFDALQRANGFVDKTTFIMYFDREFENATAILRPRRSGKSLTLKMLKEFYSVPRIDVDSYEPITKDHSNKNFKATSTFESTLLWDPEVRKEIFRNITDTEDSDWFIDDNMNKSPVIFFSLLDVGFTSVAPSKNEIIKKIIKYAIKKTFNDFDYVLFIRMVEKVCTLKYKTINRKNYLRILQDLDIDKNKDLSSRIETLWDNYGEKMSEYIKDFYRFYSGEPPYDSVSESLLLLSEILYKFYGKKVIVLVDEHDAPLQGLYSNISLDKSRRNSKIMESILHYAQIITDLLKNVCKENHEYIKKFLMFGISNSIINAPFSGFNNLKVYDVFDRKYARFFLMNEQEANHIVNFLFPEIQPNQKKMISANINKWYNGYYGDGSSKFYSLFSAGLYLNNCYKEYT